MKSYGKNKHKADYIAHSDEITLLQNQDSPKSYTILIKATCPSPIFVKLVSQNRIINDYGINISPKKTLWLTDKVTACTKKP